VVLDATVNVVHERAIAKSIAYGIAMVNFDSKKFDVKRRVMEKI
jgi:hypothetical protein